MKKQYLIAASFLLCSPVMCLAQVTAGQDYYITSNAASLKVTPISPAKGSELRQTTATDDTAKWQFIAVGSSYRIKLKNADLYLATPEKQNKVTGVKVELGDGSSDSSVWTIESNAGSYRLKNKQNNFYLGNAGNNAPAAPLKQIQSPGPGSNWKLQEAAGAAAAAQNLTASAETAGPSLKEYDTQLLTNSKSIGGANNISQNVSINYGYDVKLAYGKPDSGQGANKKYIVLEAHGTQGFNPGQVAESGETNDKAKFRGYYIESITTQARIVSGDSATLFACLPSSDTTSGTTGVSQGFSITLSGGAGGEAAGPTGGASVSIGYSFEKSSSLNWTDFAMTENSENAKCTHTYKLSSVKTIAGGLKPYTDYKDLKNANNLGIKPLNILPAKACTSFPLYEWIAFEAPATATGPVTIEIKADFVVNYVKWTGSQIVQSPETVSATKQFTVNLSEVGPTH